jgi:hypothetical protein
MHFKCHNKPTLLFLEVASAGPVHPDPVLQINVQGEVCQLQLRGIAYFGGGHFVSRLISGEGHVWFHDGITSQQSTVYHGLVDDCDLSKCDTKTAAAYVYCMI